MIVLPSYPPRRGWLTSFGIVMSALAALAASLWSTLVLGAGIVPALLAGGLLAAVAWRHPVAFKLPYRLWNGAAWRLSRFARAWLVWITYHVVLMAVALAGRDRAAMALDRTPRRSLWERRTGAGGATARRIPSRERFQFPLLLSWARETGNWWALSLAPFLLLLAQVEEERSDGTIQENVYTLF